MHSPPHLLPVMRDAADAHCVSPARQDTTIHEARTLVAGEKSRRKCVSCLRCRTTWHAAQSAERHERERGHAGCCGRKRERRASWSRSRSRSPRRLIRAWTPQNAETEAKAERALAGTWWRRKTGGCSCAKVRSALCRGAEPRRAFLSDVRVHRRGMALHKRLRLGLVCARRGRSHVVLAANRLRAAPQLRLVSAEFFPAVCGRGARLYRGFVEHPVWPCWTSWARRARGDIVGSAGTRPAKGSRAARAE